MAARAALAAALLVLLAGCGAVSETTVSVQTITFGDSPTPLPSRSPLPPTAPPPTALAGPPDVIGATAARALVDGWDAARARAEAGLDASALAAVESSPALDADRVQLQLESLGTARRPAAPSVDAVTVVVPHQSTFPAVVYATQRVTRGSSASIEVLAFVRASQAAGWMLAWHATTPDATTVVPQFTPDSGGLVPDNLDAAGQRGLVADVPSFATRLAASFRPGAAADRAIVLDQGMPDFAATARETQASFARSGDSADVEFTGSATPVAVSTSDGGAACLVVVTYTATLSGSPGRPLVETAERQYGRGLLAAGDYSQIVDTYVFTFAADVPATTGGATIFVYAVGGGLVTVTGTPAPPPGASP